MKLHRLNIFSIFLLLVFVLSSCIDDELYTPEEVGEGLSNVSATVSFQSFVPSLASRAEKGNIIHDIKNMMVLVYDANSDDTKSQLVRTEYFTEEDKTNWTLNQNGNENMPDDLNKDHYDSDKDNPHRTDENTTPSASFTINKLHYGKYHIYAVANMGLLSEDKIKTPYDLKHQILTWNNEDIAANNQMFGYFTLDNNENDRASEGFTAPLLTIGAADIKLHAWIKRAASKVTIAFDTKKLKESIRIYIHKVTIYDVPKTCVLGANNKPESNADLWPNNDNPQTIYYGEGDDYHN
ncbi:MAG: hypothetical protein K2K94_03075, partial [Muribaculaceae bacterium]|nr:hypothetical protein [Muribaculaceae bacterium]